MNKVMFFALILLVVAVGCNTTGQRTVYRSATPDMQVLNTRAVVVSTAADPETERSAQEWARIAADRERQQMEFQLRQQEQDDRRMEQYARQAQQRERDEAQKDWAENQQKLNLLREGRYALNDVLRQAGQFRANGNNGAAGPEVFQRVPRQR